MATLNTHASVHIQSQQQSKTTHSTAFVDCLVNASYSLFLMTLGGLSAGALLLMAGDQTQQVLTAASATMVALYLANLSEGRNIRDFLSMVIPSVAILITLRVEPQSLVFLGYTLVIHATLGFYNALSRPNGAMSEMNLWPGLFGFQMVQLGVWGFML